MFSPSECKLVYRLQRTIGHEGREIRQGKQLLSAAAAQQLRAVIRQSVNSTGR
jgi:hypothetical protein